MEEEATVMCSNCERAIAESKAFLHEAYCLRNVVRCPKCNEPVDKNEMEEHEAEKHKLVSCQYCKQSMENTNLATHEGSCLKKPRMCSFCNCEVTGEEYTDHVYRCGSRTKKCPHCNKNILVRDYENHEPVCQVSQFSGESYQEHFPGIREEAKTEGTREKVSPYPSFNPKHSSETSSKNNPYEYLAESKKNKEPLEKKSVEQSSQRIKSSSEIKKTTDNSKHTNLPHSTNPQKSSQSQKPETYQPYNYHHVEEKKPSVSSNPTSYLKTDHKATVSPNFNEVNIGYSNPQISSTSTQSNARKDDIYSNISTTNDLSSKYGIPGKSDLSKYGIPETNYGLKYGVSGHSKDAGLNSHSNKTSLPHYDASHARVNQNLNAHKIFDNPRTNPTSDLGKHNDTYRSGAHSNLPHETHSYPKHEITSTSQQKSTHSNNYKPIVSTSSQKSHVDSYLTGIDATKSKPSYGIAGKHDYKATGTRDLNQKTPSYLSSEKNSRDADIYGRKPESIQTKPDTKYQDPRSSNSYNQNPKIDISQKYTQKDSLTTSKHPREINSNARQKLQEEAHRKHVPSNYHPSQPTRNTRDEYDEDNNEFIGGDEEIQRAIEESLKQKKSTDPSRRSQKPEQKTTHNSQNPTRNIPSNISTQNRSRPQHEFSRPQESNTHYVEDDEETQRAIQDSLKHSQKQGSRNAYGSHQRPRDANQESHNFGQSNTNDDELQRVIEESLKMGQNRQTGFNDTFHDENFKRILEQSKYDK